MNYFFILGGLFLVGLAVPSILAEKKARYEVPKPQESDSLSPVLVEYILSLEHRLGVLSDTLREFIQMANGRSGQGTDKNASFVEILADAGKNNSFPDVYEQIYNGFARGKNITELAREFGKGKGEIELILNLKK